MRSFTLTISADAALRYAHDVVVPEGGDVRAHDVALVLRHLASKLDAMGSAQMPTVSEVVAARERAEAANAVMAEWEPTLDGVCVVGTTHSRTYVKKGYDVPVVAVCDASGNPTMDTVATLAAWQLEA